MRRCVQTFDWYCLLYTSRTAKNVTHWSLHILAHLTELGYLLPFRRLLDVETKEYFYLLR